MIILQYEVPIPYLNQPKGHLAKPAATPFKNMDIFSKSDPLCVIFEKAQDSDEWFEIGRTEFIKDTLNPDFEKAIDIDFFFEKSQLLRFEFIDDDGGDSDDPYYDIIGSTTCQLSELMASKGQTVTKPLLVPGKRR